MALIFKKHRSSVTADFVVSESQDETSKNSSSVQVQETISLSPGNSFHLKNCFVCGEVSKSGEDFVRSYGGVACCSCRAYFRRATHRSKERRMICKKDKKCNVMLQNRQSCKKCRYDKCLENGMDPNLVLSEEQKRVRFRKLLSKKKELGKNNDLAQKNVEPKMIPYKRPLVVPITNDVPFSSRIEGVEMIESSSTSYADPKVKSILEKFNISLELMKRKPTIQVQLSPDNGTRQHSLKKILLEHFVGLSNQFRDFASQWSSFNKFSKSLQKELLERGTPNYLQVMIIFYTTTYIGKIRLRELLKLEVNESINSLNELNKMSNLFKESADLKAVNRLLTNLDFLKLEVIECRATLAFILLFDWQIIQRFDVENNEAAIVNTVLFDRCRRTRQNVVNVANVGNVFNVVSLENFLSMVVRLSIFFASNIEWSQIVFPPNSLQPNIHNFNLNMGYAREEESWLFEKLQKLEEAYGSVPMGQDCVDVRFTFSEGKPIPIDYTVQAVRVFHERARRILNIHSEFLSLPSETQSSYLKSNGTSAVALITAHLELCSNGFEQLKECFGSPDNTYLKSSRFPGLANPEKIPKVYLFDHSEAHVESMTMQKWIEHGRIVGDLAKVINDPVLYKLLLLLTLTKTPSHHGRQHDDLAHLHSTYFNVLHRRHTWIDEEMVRQGSLCNLPSNPTDIISRVCQSLKDIDRLARIHQDLAQSCIQQK